MGSSMRQFWPIKFGLLLSACLSVSSASAQESQLESNKQIARQFYEDLWLNNRTERYQDYVAESYVVHDTGKRKNVTEPASEQKGIADFFWQNGEISGGIDYQIAEGDLVATRWRMKYAPRTWFGRLFLGAGEIPIINVFRFEDGKIVEIWNHRHDIDTPQTRAFTFKGFLIGLAVGCLPWLIGGLRRRRRT